MAFLSSSPPQQHSRHVHHSAYGLLQPPSSSPFGSSRASASSNFDHLQLQHLPEGDNGSRAGGQLSPTFDQAFQDVMNISAHSLSSDPPSEHEHDEQQDDTRHDALGSSTNSVLALKAGSRRPKFSPMDISPGPANIAKQATTSFFALPPQIHHDKPASDKNSSTSSIVSKTNKLSTTAFDSTFFNRLAAHSPVPSASSRPDATLSTNSTFQRTRTRTSSSDGILSDRDVNTIPSTNIPPLLKRNPNLLRTASSAAAFVPSKTGANPFDVSPRPSLAAPHLMERAKSDNQLVFAKPPLNKDTRRLSGLSKETVTGSRPSIVPYTLQSQGRRISGSSRVRNSIPQVWQQGLDASSLDAPPQPPKLLHTLSAPLVKPADWGRLQPLHSANVSGPSHCAKGVMSGADFASLQSEPAVPTRRTLGTDFGSRLAREILVSSSPNGMDIDMDSPARPSLLDARRPSLACSPGLGDLFEEGGVDAASSPLPAAPEPSQPFGNRKRVMEDPDSSFTGSVNGGNDEDDEVEELDDAAAAASPAHQIQYQSASNPNSFSRATGAGFPRVLHRATSAASLNAASRKRGSGLSSGHSASSSALFFAGTDNASAENLGLGRPPSLSSIKDKDSSRHRKMSRGVDGRPSLVKHSSSSFSRRAHSMCDSDFYASPPLATAEGNSSRRNDYFGSAAHASGPLNPPALSKPVAPAQPKRTVSSTVTGSAVFLRPEDALSPPRLVANNPALQTYQPSPEQSQSFTSGFGCKEAEGKILPCHSVKEDGLMRITADTLNDLLGGAYDDHIDKFIVIDCRFEYEYAGGHVEGAINLPTPAQVEEFFLSHGDSHPLYANEAELPPPTKSGRADRTGNTKKTILVFHCEFSCKRAPTLAKHLRSRDRALNHASYPAVHYPELYVLQGGYAECWKTHPERCDPQGYVTMDDPRHLRARANDIMELRRKRLGIRAKSYTFGENMFGGGANTAVNGQKAAQNGTSGASKHLSTLAFGNKPGALAAPALSKLSGLNKVSHQSFNASLFSGVINTASLCVHEEDEHEDHPGNSSTSGECEADGDTSFTGTRHAANAGAAKGRSRANTLQQEEDETSSSPCAPMTGMTGSIAMLDAGDSPCPLNNKPSKFSFGKPSAGAPGGLFAKFASAAPARPGFGAARTLQRANTSQGLPFGL